MIRDHHRKRTFSCSTVGRATAAVPLSTSMEDASAFLAGRYASTVELTDRSEFELESALDPKSNFFSISSLVASFLFFWFVHAASQKVS